METHLFINLSKFYHIQYELKVTFNIFPKKFTFYRGHIKNFIIFGALFNSTQNKQITVLFKHFCKIEKFIFKSTATDRWVTHVGTVPRAQQRRPGVWPAISHGRWGLWPRPSYRCDPHGKAHLLVALIAPVTAQTELDAGHGGHGGAAVLCRRNKASSG